MCNNCFTTSRRISLHSSNGSVFLLVNYSTLLNSISDVNCYEIFNHIHLNPDQYVGCTPDGFTTSEILIFQYNWKPKYKVHMETWIIRIRYQQTVFHELFRRCQINADNVPNSALLQVFNSILIRNLLKFIIEQHLVWGLGLLALSFDPNSILQDVFFSP